MYRKIVVFVLISFLFSACKLFYGIKKPKAENKQSLLSYLEKIDMPSDNVYTLDFDEYVQALKLIKNKLPDVLIFDKNGNYIPYGEEWACNAGAFSFIADLNDTVSYRKSQKTSIKTLPFRLNNMNGEGANISFSDASFHVFIFWARWTGKLNKNHVKIWEQQAKDNHNSKIKVYKVNMDFQQYWGDTIIKQLTKKGQK